MYQEFNTGGIILKSTKFLIVCFLMSGMLLSSTGIYVGSTKAATTGEGHFKSKMVYKEVNIDPFYAL